MARHRRRVSQDVQDLGIQGATWSGGSHLNRMINWVTYYKEIRDITNFGVDTHLHRIGHGRQKPVYHVKLVGSARPHTETWTEGTKVYTPVNYQNPVGRWHSSMASLYTSLSSSSVTNAAQEAFNEFSTQMPTEVSIANFALEAREFRSLIPKIERNLIRGGAGSYLQWQFGWKPLLGDLTKLYNLTDSVRARLQFLRDSYGKEVSLGYYKKLSYPAGLPLDGTTSGSWRDIAQLTDYQAGFRARGTLYHKLEGLNDSLSELKAFSAALGLNNPVMVAWEAMPYSFVIDYFVKIGTLLDRLAIQPFQGVWRITDVSASVKEAYRFNLDQHYGSISQPRRTYGKAVVERYQRWGSLPVTGSFLSTALTDKQQLLLTALLLAR